MRSQRQLEKKDWGVGKTNKNIGVTTEINEKSKGKRNNISTTYKERTTCNSDSRDLNVEDPKILDQLQEVMSKEIRKKIANIKRHQQKEAARYD